MEFHPLANNNSNSNGAVAPSNGTTEAVAVEPQKIYRDCPEAILTGTNTYKHIEHYHYTRLTHHIITNTYSILSYIIMMM